MKRLFAVIMLLGIGAVTGFAQSPEAGPMRYGVYGGYDLNLHSASFTELPGIPNCCPRFESGNGGGLAAGALVEFPLSRRWLLDLRAGLAQQDGLLSVTEQTGVILGGTPRTGSFEHRVDAQLTTIGLEPSIGLRLTDRLMLRAGFRAGMLVTSTFSQVEELISPEGRGTFIDEAGNDTHKRTRNEAEGDIPGAAKLQAALQVGAGYDLPLNARKTLILAPEISYSLPVTSILDGGGWQVHTFRFGVAVKYGAEVEEAPVRMKDRIDTLRIPVRSRDSVRFAAGVPSIRFDTVETAGRVVIRQGVVRMDTMFALATDPKAKLTVTALYEDGTTSEAAALSVNSRFVTEALPLLTYVFFDATADVLPERYIHRPALSPIEEEQSHPDPISFHRNILNIVGERMNKLPNTTLSLRGTVDPATEAGDCALARRRAQAVQTYLVDTWHIAKERIIIEEQAEGCAPRSLTESPVAEGYAENRRVELSSPDGRLLEPLLCRRTSEVTAITPPALVCDPAGSSSEGVRRWSIEAGQEGTQIFAQTGTGVPQVVQNTLDPARVEKLVDGIDVTVRLTVQDESGASVEAVQSIAVHRDTSDVEIHRMSLILFDVAQDVLKESARVEILSFLAGITSADEIAVTGYTDLLGLDEENRKLADRRAQTICGFIQQLVANATMTRCVGVAFTQFPPHLGSYLTPEERFLARTVQIEIRKKTGKYY